jgi:hypothetical protein
MALLKILAFSFLPATLALAQSGRQFSLDVLRHAVADAVKTTTPIALIARDGECYRTLNIDYHDGEKYPHPVRDKSKPDLISGIIRPHLTGGSR